jgi:hypothetical protein
VQSVCVWIILRPGDEVKLEADRRSIVNGEALERSAIPFNQEEEYISCV